MAQYRKLVQKTITIIQNFTLKESLPDLVARFGLLDELSLLPIPEDHPDQQTIISSRSLISHPNLRLTIYWLPPRTTMKLHNHPNMNIVTYVMDGSMQAHMFNPISQCKEKKSWMSDAGLKFKVKRIGEQSLYRVESKKLERGSIEFIEGIRMPKLNNLHQFQSLETGCVFIDIIFPDYNDDRHVYKTYNSQKISNDPEIYCLTQCEDDRPQIAQI